MRKSRYHPPNHPSSARIVISVMVAAGTYRSTFYLSCVGLGTQSTVLTICVVSSLCWLFLQKKLLEFWGELELYCRGGPSRPIDLVPNLSTEVVSTNGVDKVSTKLPLEEILPLMLETKEEKESTKLLSFRIWKTRITHTNLRILEPMHAYMHACIPDKVYFARLCPFL